MTSRSREIELSSANLAAALEPFLRQLSSLKPNEHITAVTTTGDWDKTFPLTLIIEREEVKVINHSQNGPQL